MISEIKTMQRDLKLNQLYDSKVITVDISSFPSRLYFWWKKRRMIKYLLKKGYILTGSRALNCYLVNDRKVIDRKSKDWDFLVTKEQFIDICRDYKIYDFNFNSKSYRIDNHLMVFSGSYSSSETIVLPTTIELFIKDKLPDFVESNGVRFASLDSIIECKLELVEKNIEVEKHRIDLKSIYVNLHQNDI